MIHTNSKRNIHDVAVTAVAVTGTAETFLVTYMYVANTWKGALMWQYMEGSRV